jgi:hypothetical protein
MHLARSGVVLRPEPGGSTSWAVVEQPQIVELVTRMTLPGTARRADTAGRPPPPAAQRSSTATTPWPPPTPPPTRRGAARRRRRRRAPSTSPERPLAGPVIAVTGAARGIGAAMVATFARDGATVLGLDVAPPAADLQRMTGAVAGSPLVAGAPWPRAGGPHPSRLAGFSCLKHQLER